MADWITVAGTALTAVLGGGGVTALWIKGKTSRQERFENNILAEIKELKDDNKHLRDEVESATRASIRADSRTDILMNAFVQLLNRYKRTRRDYRELLKSTQPGFVLEVDEFESMEAPDGTDLWSSLFGEGSNETAASE